ncbi:beta-glucanase [Grosmannia clavigera kw1407]|uniref:Beta-glucanase n=1 Tax=Grosmannia clavigera (strain kw1407 / UAMH 11150) TaxID=655863 RepID=F0XIT6_GROCL|nr:beta-glucanase [Grosmannia clavigera kw1407]EFX02319.1 beta-glucanase [Grosmannia clavigera kw1407]
MYPFASAASLFLASLPALVQAWDAPAYSGYSLVWQEAFAGYSGTLPSSTTWNIITDISVNEEAETYTTSTSNLQLSGGNTLQIIPICDSAGSWTSGRIESSYTFTPAAGKITFAEADIRFGGNSIANKQGLWPAFWMLGDSLRHGTSWPQSGEVDALETVNGLLTGYGTLHCGSNPNGPCNEPTGVQNYITFSDQSWHVWRVKWDRSSNDWESESITWYMDDQQYHIVTGSSLGNEDDWASVCHDPLYFILNLAVGGSWPGDPNSSTKDGYGSMMEVAYVAVYSN